MIINDIQFTASLEDILSELQRQLAINNIPLLQKMHDSGDNIMVQCPYHGNGQEHRPSAGIHKETGIFHCFACQETHSLQEVISYCLGYYDDLLGTVGWSWLLKNFATIQVEERKDVTLDFNRDDNIHNPNIREFVSEEELEQYRYYHPYQTQRGLTEEIINLFDIGYDHATDCITFPIRDIDGNCLFVARRSVKTKWFNYPSGAEKPLYGLYEYNLAIQETQPDIIYGLPFNEWDSSQVIICESMLDALSFWGVNKYAFALNGLGNELQFKQLRQLPCRKLILCTDSDEAGMNARKRIKKNVPNKLITEYILPKGRKDANECTIDELIHLEEIF